MADYNIDFIQNKDYVAEHLLSSEENLHLIQTFSVGNNAFGLERYLKEDAVNDEHRKQSRTYLIKDRITKELVCYFSLKTGLIPLEIKSGVFETFSAIELANFAVNQNYKTAKPNIPKIGYYVFQTFIIPIVKFISEYVGACALYIYALPNDKLILYYQQLGFSRLPLEQEKFVQQHVKPKYDTDCIFMYQIV